MNALGKKVRRFIRIEDGLVTVEWVALTAGMVVAAVAIAFIVMENTLNEGAAVGGGITDEVEEKFQGFGEAPAPQP